VIAVTLAFAICWLPIHVLELMQCAKSPLLTGLIQSYPKVLYSVRAFTHALAYFNSCLNPYLYALLNRNYCIDLVDIIPSWRRCCKHTQTLENGQPYSNLKLSPRNLPPSQLHLSEKYLAIDDERPQPTNDVSCQVELLDRSYQDISSFQHSTQLTRTDYSD
jgi:hypothetical protein